MKKWIQKTISALLTPMIIFGTVSTSFAGTSDISKHWASAYLKTFVEEGYLSGDGTGNYNPDQNMTRAQYASILNRILGLTEESSSISNYSDVHSKDWYYVEMAKALAKGYISGTTSDTIAPNAALTRQQAFTMIARILGLDTENVDTSVLEQFSDASELASWAKNSVAALVKSGYVTGTNGKLLPKQSMTRAEGVTIIYRAKEALKNAATVGLTAENAASKYKDGVYVGTGAGYGGTLKLQVTVSGDKITGIKILSQSETYSYFNRAKDIIEKILSGQDPDSVDTISGATRTSKAILTAVNACLSQASGGKDTSTTSKTRSLDSGGISETPNNVTYSNLVDGTYVGQSTGYSGITKVSVVVQKGVIASVTIVSHGDTPSYFSSSTGVIPKVVASNSTNVDVISGATHSSKGILAAIENALSGASSNKDTGEGTAENTSVTVDRTAKTVSIGTSVYAYGGSSLTGGTQIGSTGVYYKLSSGSPLNGTLYGRTAMTYAEYYKNQITGNKTLSQLYNDGLYDAVTSATSAGGSHFSHYPSILNYTAGDTNDLANKPMTIDGIDTVDIAVNVELYIESMVLYAADKNTTDAAAQAAAKIQLNANTSKPIYGNAVKTLNSDGTYSAANSVAVAANNVIKTNTITVNPTVAYSSAYGDYQFTMNFSGFNTSDSENVLYYTNYLMNFYGAIVSDGTKTTGAVYYEDTWEETTHKCWIDLALSNGSFTAKGHAFNNYRFADFFGTGSNEKVMKPGTYTVVLKARGYEDIEASFMVGTKLGSNEKLTVQNATWNGGATCSVYTSLLPDDFEADTIGLTYGSGRKAVTLIEGTDYTYGSGNLVILDSSNTGMGVYTLTLTDNTYQPASASFTVNSDLTSSDISIVNNTLTIKPTYAGTATISDYIAAISAVSVDGSALKGENLGTAIFNTDGTINFDATLTTKGTTTPVFAKGAGAIYTLATTAIGYPSLSDTVTAP